MTSSSSRAARNNGQDCGGSASESSKLHHIAAPLLDERSFLDRAANAFRCENAGIFKRGGVGVVLRAANASVCVLRNAQVCSGKIDEGGLAVAA